MDPLDREKPWSRIGQMLLITSVIGVIYLIFRFAVVVPEWGWQVIAAATATGALLYVSLVFRTPRAPITAEESRAATRKGLKGALMLFVILGLTLPIWVLVYFVWTGGELWR